LLGVTVFAVNIHIERSDNELRQMGLLTILDTHYHGERISSALTATLEDESGREMRMSLGVGKRILHVGDKVRLGFTSSLICDAEVVEVIPAHKGAKTHD
jgi:hypothetical protein